MADIMMCNAVCPVQRRCKRHKASGTKPDPKYQNYWMRGPNTPLGADCPRFWEIDNG